MALMNQFRPECPDCPKNKWGKGPILECSEDNYSGCGEDMANCPDCGKGYAISFKIDEITRCTDWDVEIEPEEPWRNPLELL